MLRLIPRGKMQKLTQMLAEADKLNLASITEIHTGAHLSSLELKQGVKEKIKVMVEEYGVTSGQCVLLLQNNSIEFFIHFLSLLCIGATAIPLDKNIKEVELKNIIDFTTPSLIITDQGFKLSSGGKRAQLEGVALVLFTSGTTSLPKGVMISKKSLLDKMNVLERYIGLDCLKNTLCFIPTYFGHGLICNSLFPLLKGRNFYIAPKMDMEFADNFIEILKKYEISFFSSVPSHWELILNFSGCYDGNHLKRVQTASAPLKKEKIKAILNWLKGIPFFDIYGATEMLGWFASREVEDAERVGEFDTFWDVEKKVLADNVLGVRSSYMFDKYWGEDKREMFFSTGDIFDGQTMTGRSKNVIIKNGIKIYTDELNDELMKSQMITDVGAFPIDDQFTGERVGAFVVMGPNFSLQDLVQYCRSKLSPDNMPSEFITVDTIPTNARGKSSLAGLRDHYEGLKNERK